MNREIFLGKAVGETLGFTHQHVTVRDVTGRQIVKDATFKFLVLDKAGAELAFVLMSNEDYPDAVQMAAESAQNATRIVGEDLADIIVEPLSINRLGNQSYAVFPYYSMLNAGRLSRVIARQSLVPQVCRWLEQVALKTTRLLPESRQEEAVITPLQWLAAEAAIAPHIRADALSALNALDEDKWHPACVFSHNDLWSGNVLVKPRRFALLAPLGFGEPRIIDWLSSSKEGIPGYDLLNFAASTGYSLIKIKDSLDRVNRQAGRDGDSTYFDLLAGFGRLGLNRGEFPLERFSALLSSIANHYRQLSKI